jgi:hypothetical protein
MHRIQFNKKNTLTLFRSILIKSSILISIIFTFSAQLSAETLCVFQERFFYTKATKCPLGSNNVKDVKSLNGSLVLNGYGIPKSETGNDGDFYIDLSSLTFFPAKINGKWDKSISMRSFPHYSTVDEMISKDSYFIANKYYYHSYNRLYGGSVSLTTGDRVTIEASV